jgi:archaemetzincin
MPAQPIFLGLVAVGPVDPEILRRLAPAIAEFLALPVQLLAPKPLPAHTYHVGRDQYHSTQLLEYLLADSSAGALRILGITSADLYIPIFNFIFGEAQVDGSAAIISLFRPSGGGEADRPPISHLLKRLLKLGLHELGHTFGLGHCRQEGCLMGFSANLEILDRKNLDLCQYCQIMLADYFRSLGLDASLKRYEEIPAPTAANQVVDSSPKNRRQSRRR